MLHCENNIKINHFHYYSCNCYFQSNDEAVLSVGNYISNQSSGPACEHEFNKFGFQGKHPDLHWLSQIWGRSLTSSYRGCQKGLETIISLNCFFLWNFLWALCVLSIAQNKRGNIPGFEGWKEIFCLIWKTEGVKGKVWIPCYWISGLWLPFYKDAFPWLNWNYFTEERPH